MKEKGYTQWTRKEFESLPMYESFDNRGIGECSALVILPGKHRHASGYRQMYFITIQNGVPTYKIGGSSDIIHLGGIGGDNDLFRAIFQERTTRLPSLDGDDEKPRLSPRVAWEIDCLPVSGLLRIYCNLPIYVGESISSFGLYYKE